MKFSKPLALVCLTALCFAVSAPTAATTEALVDAAFDALGARAVSCPQSVENALDEGQTVRCASLESRFSEFRKSWRRFLKEQKELEIVEVGDWSRSGPHWRRSLYQVDNIPLAVAFSESNSGVMLTYGVPTPMCESPTPEELALPFAGTEGITMPKLAGGTKVSIMSPHGGAAHVNVKLKIKVDRAGKTEVLCVLSATPERYDVEDEVVRSVEATRYQPATRNGEPLDVAMTVVYDW